MSQVSNGICEAACNVPECAFDGGDCMCTDKVIGPGICRCSDGMQRRADGCECETEPKGFLKTDASFLEEALFRRTDATTFEGASEKIDFSGRLKMPCN